MNKHPAKINLEAKNLYYEGSVQNLYTVTEYPDLLISETTSGGSVFDVGTIFKIEGSDIGRASFRHLVFQELEKPQAWSNIKKAILIDKISSKLKYTDILENMYKNFEENGASTHHLGMINNDGMVFSDGFPPNPSNLTLIRKFEVAKPSLKKCLNWHFYDYEKYYKMDNYIVPLEYIVRFGVTSGSSILRKYDTLSELDKEKYLIELGVEEPLSAWCHFNCPIVDFTTKYEPEDRNISFQEAAIMSGVSGDEFSKSVVMALLGSFLVQQIFGKMGLFLWDLKWEIVRTGHEFIFADTIDTDSVRATVNVTKNGKSYYVHFNKQAMRDYYKIMCPDWYSGVNKAKMDAAKTGKKFTEVLLEGQKKNELPPTPEIDEKFLTIQEQKFAMLQSFVQQFDENPDFQEITKQIAQLEVEYYLSSEKKDSYEKLNSVSV